MTVPPPGGAHPAVPPAYDTGPGPRLDPIPPDPPRVADISDASVGELLGNVARDLSTLMRQELALAQAELRQEAKTTGKAAGALGAAGLAGWFVILFLSLALWAALSELMHPGWAALIVAVIWAAIAGALYAAGRANLRKVRPKPERTVDTLSQVPEALKGHRGGRP
jgi:Putative Actinobacterial Holin-X, holin superfamily III